MNRTELLLVVFILKCILPSLTFASQRHVPLQYRIIQSAIDASQPLDTIIVHDGRYFENIVIRKNIVVASLFLIDGDRSHIERTIIDGSRSLSRTKASTVTFQNRTDSTSALIGFTIRGGSGSYDFAPGDPFSEHWIGGGGVALDNAGARIAHNIISNNIVIPHDSLTFTFGGGIASINAFKRNPLPPFCIIEYNSVIGNQCYGARTEGAGIFIGQPGIVRHNTVMLNKLNSTNRSPGGGVFTLTTNEYDIIVDGNYIRKNSAGIGGGVLVTSAFERRGRAIVTNNIIAENDAFEVGGGVNVAEEAYAIFINNTIVRNKGLASGGGMNVTYGAHAVLVNNIIWDNENEQISLWGIVQAYHNLSDGTLSGKNNILLDPEFLPDDSLFRLSLRSPCIGTGLSTLMLAGNTFPMPQRDFFGNLRNVSGASSSDLGAVKSPWELSFAAKQLLSDHKRSNEASVKLAFYFRQYTPADRDKNNHQILRAGSMTASYIVNDTSAPISMSDSVLPLFVLPPGQNLLEVEIQARSRDSLRGLNVFYHLDGADPRVQQLRRRNSYSYASYTDLKPGSYTLVMQPQDEEQIIGHTNRISVKISVLPFWYQQWWSYVLFTSIIIISALILYQTRVNRLVLKQQLAAEHLQKEKLNELNQMKSRFLANVSHELRTPLSLIIGPIEYLLAQTRDQESVEQLGLIHRNARRLMRMIELLLQYSRLESGTIKLRVSLMDILPLVRRITGYFSSPAVKKHIELRFMPESDRIEGYCDAEKIEHIIQNCLSNALKFTPAGGTIDIRVNSDGVNATISIIDTGEGIAPEHLPHIFERFYRAETTHKTEGTGIGLSLSKELAEIHHGSLRLESEFGKGTTALIIIPLTGYSETEIITRQAKEEESQEPLHGMSSIDQAELSVPTDEMPVILVAEDNEDARIFIKTQLRRQYSVLEAEDGVDALNKTKFQIPDLVISDIMMPKIDGRELCQSLKQDERTCHIPVILLTALAEKDDRIAGLNVGADDYLVKPFDAQELLTRVRNILENRKKIREAFGRTVMLKPGEVAVQSLDDAFLTKAIAVVTTHIRDSGFGAETFSREVFLSRTQLHRKLKAITNLSTTDFIRHLRLQRSKELLEKNAGTIAEIADSVGFTNHSYFARCFQEQFGILPNEVRKSNHA